MIADGASKPSPEVLLQLDRPRTFRLSPGAIYLTKQITGKDPLTKAFVREGRTQDLVYFFFACLSEDDPHLTPLSLLRILTPERMKRVRLAVSGMIGASWQRN